MRQSTTFDLRGQHAGARPGEALDLNHHRDPGSRARALPIAILAIAFLVIVTWLAAAPRIDRLESPAQPAPMPVPSYGSLPQPGLAMLPVKILVPPPGFLTGV
jgi:hypothetical protein